jgi:thiamine pyrophosphokinase
MIPEVINLKEYRSILCLNGHLPEASFFKSMNIPVIAADGAANYLLSQGIAPQLIIGDLDSVQPHLLKEHAVLHLPDQDRTDYQKAMHYLKEHQLLPSIIVGINGGHLDHILNNINLFMETECLLYAPPIQGFVIKEQASLHCSLPLQTKISLIGLPKAILSSKGLKWELNNTHLSFPGPTSCFNRTHSSEIKLEVHQGAVLVLFYEEFIKDAGI